MSENNMPTGFERGDLFAKRPEPTPEMTTDKDDVAHAYALLLQAKKQIEADGQEIDQLKANHLVSVGAWKAEIEKLRGDEAQQRFRADRAQVEIDRLRERNMILEQGKQLVLIQFCNDILILLSEFGYATPEKGYDSPSAVLGDLRSILTRSEKIK